MAVLGGFDERWSDEKEAEAIGCCLICSLIPRDAVAHACGQLFCQACWSQWQVTARGCSKCRQSGNADPAHKDRRAVLNLKLFCSSGCGAAMSLCDKSRHQELHCIHRRISCPSCTEPTTPTKLSLHMSVECRNREIKCPACGCSSTPFLLTVHQKEECPARAVMCMLCQELVPSQSLGQHMAESSDTHLLALCQSLAKRDQEISSLRAELLETRLKLASQQSELSSLKTYVMQEMSSANRYGVAVSQRTNRTSNERKVTSNKRHTGRIGATPNGISRLDGEYNIFWNKEVTRNPVAGYVFENFKFGWKEALSVVYSESRWSCCGQTYDAEGCGY